MTKKKEFNVIEVPGKLYYAFLKKPDRYKKFSVAVVVDDATNERLKSIGLSPSVHKKGGDLVAPSELGADGTGFVYKFRSNENKADGTPRVIKIVDASGVTEINEIIGNGSSGAVAVHVYEVDGNTYGALFAVQVTDLIKYVPKEGAEASTFGSTFTKKEGFTAGGSTLSSAADKAFDL